MNTVENLKAEKEIWIKVKQTLSLWDSFMCHIIQRLTKEPLTSSILDKMRENRPDDTRKAENGAWLNVWWPSGNLQGVQKRKSFCDKMISLCEKEIAQQFISENSEINAELQVWQKVLEWLQTKPVRPFLCCHLLSLYLELKIPNNMYCHMKQRMESNRPPENPELGGLTAWWFQEDIQSRIDFVIKMMELCKAEEKMLSPETIEEIRVWEEIKKIAKTSNFNPYICNNIKSYCVSKFWQDKMLARMKPYQPLQLARDGTGGWWNCYANNPERIAFIDKMIELCKQESNQEISELSEKNAWLLVHDKLKNRTETFICNTIHRLRDKKIINNEICTKMFDTMKQYREKYADFKEGFIWWHSEEEDRIKRCDFCISMANLFERPTPIESYDKMLQIANGYYPPPHIGFNVTLNW